VLGPGRPEVSCEQCFDLLDRLVDVEREGSRNESEARFPGMQAHLEGCPACREEHDLLYAYARGRER
jgi:hypothetical protein